MKKMTRLVLIFLLIFATVGCSAGGILTQPRDPSYDTDSTVSWEDALLTSSSDTDSEDDDYDSDDAYTDYYSSSGNKYYTKEEFVRECRSVLENNLNSLLTIQNVEYADDDSAVSFQLVEPRTDVVFGNVIALVPKEEQPNGSVTGVTCIATAEAITLLSNMDSSEGQALLWATLLPTAYAFMKPHAGYDMSWETFIGKLYTEEQTSKQVVRRIDVGDQTCRLFFGDLAAMGCGSVSDIYKDIS